MSLVAAVRPMRARVIGLYAALFAANAAVWAWAFVSFRHIPLLLGTALLAYSLGLRHAVDADHIAAIDNVTRKLIEDGRRPVSVGLWFSLGHSTVVVAGSLGLALLAGGVGARFSALRHLGSVAGTAVSALFLFVIAIINLQVLRTVFLRFRGMRAGTLDAAAERDALFAGGGLLARLCRPLFALIRAEWHMYPLGFLFGLGFDTATEVGLLGISASQAAHGLPLRQVLVFPLLFTAGMALADTTDNVLMVGAYGWAFVRPLRKLYYNLTITAISVLVALAVGSIEALGLLADQLQLSGRGWDLCRSLNANLGAMGYGIVLVFVLCWAASIAYYKWRGFDHLESMPGSEMP